MKKLIFILLSLLTISQFNLAQSSLDEAEDFQVKDVNGITHNLFPYLEEGKIVVVPFFTTTCGSCNIYTPEIVESFQDFGCNQGDVFYLGVNWGADNIGVIDFMTVHAVEFPCASGLEGLGNLVNEQYGIASHITALVIQPDGTIAGQFFGPYAYPTRDSLDNLLLSLGADMQSCSVGIQEEDFSKSVISPNPARDFVSITMDKELNADFKINLFDITGKLQKTYNIHSKENDQISLEISDLPKGIYFIEVLNKDKIVLKQKFIKK